MNFFAVGKGFSHGEGFQSWGRVSVMGKGFSHGKGFHSGQSFRSGSISVGIFPEHFQF